VFQTCITGILQADIGRPLRLTHDDGRRQFNSKRLNDFRISKQAKVRANLPEYPAVSGHDGAPKNLMVRAAQCTDAGLRPQPFLGLIRPHRPGRGRRKSTRNRSGHAGWLDPHRLARTRRRRRRQFCPIGDQRPSRNRARHVAPKPALRGLDEPARRTWNNAREAQR